MDFTTACLDGNLGRVKEFLADGTFDPVSAESDAVECAVMSGCLDVVRVLLEDGRVDPSGGGENAALMEACVNGDLGMVQLLMGDTRVTPNSDMLVVSCSCGHLDVVKCLINHPNVDPGYSNNLAMVSACENAQGEIMQFLMKYRDDVNEKCMEIASFGSIDSLRHLLQDGRLCPTANNNKALRVALEWLNYSAINLLLDDQRVWNSPRVPVDLYVLENVAATGDIELMDKLLMYGGEIHLPTLLERFPREMEYFA